MCIPGSQIALQIPPLSLSFYLLPIIRSWSCRRKTSTTTSWRCWPTPGCGTCTCSRTVTRRRPSRSAPARCGGGGCCAVIIRIYGSTCGPSQQVARPRFCSSRNRPPCTAWFISRPGPWWVIEGGLGCGWDDFHTRIARVGGGNCASAREVPSRRK